MNLGGAGLLVLGFLDSSFLVAPFGNDLLMVALTARHHAVGYMLYLAAMATVGSAAGVTLVDLVVRPAAEKGLERHFPQQRIAYLKRKIEGQGSWALIVAALAPPPFPFTPFIMAAAALQIPWRRLVGVIGAARMVRYTVLGFLALRFGERILHWAGSPAFEWCLTLLVVLSILASVLSVYRWIQNSRRSAVPAGK